jgi:hypothetical protein
MRLYSMAVLCAAIACGEASPVRSTDAAALHQQKVAGNLIDHGGAVLASSRTVAIYWGDQSAFPSDLESGMTSLLSGFSNSTYLGIAQQYMRFPPNSNLTIATTYAGALIDTSAPPSHAPRAADLGAEVCNLVGTPDASTLYLVFTSNAPHISYCAWHDKATCNNVTFQVAYIPNPALLPNCSPYTKKNLHCNGYSDGTVTAADNVAHEFMETVTDPHIDAWLDQNGQEMADKCNFDYQACVSLPTGSWQIQSEWSNAISGCQQQ